MRTFRVKCFGPGLAIGLLLLAAGCSKDSSSSSTAGGSSGASTSGGTSTGSACSGVADCTNPACANAACDDGDACTSNDLCASDGGCLGTVVTCDDGDACTSDACLAADGGCAHEPVICDDSNPCTTDTCDAASGCAHATVADGTACGGGQLCLNGQCGDGCEIAGATYASGAVNPANGCQSCQPGTSTTAWTAKADGLTCDDGNACTTGDQCSSGLCAGSTADCNDSRACTVDSCDPASGCMHTNSPDGTDCANGLVCSSGVCEAGCVIAGTYYQLNDPNPNNPCQVCDFSNPHAWTNRTGSCDDGEACTRNDTCSAGVCAGTPYSCSGGGDCQGPPSCDGNGGCLSNPVPDGSACNSNGGNYCHQGNCEFGCYIDGTFYPALATNPSSSCQTCLPVASDSTWHNAASGTGCGPGGASCALCNTQGQCVSQCNGGVGPNFQVCCANGTCGSLGQCGPGNG